MRNTIQRDNRKSLPRFLLIILLSAFLGAIGGFFSAIAAEKGMLDRLWAALDQIMTIITPWAIPSISILMLIPAFLLLHTSKTRFAIYDQESEEETQGIEDRLSYALLLSTLVYLADLFFLAASFLYANPLINAACFLVSIGVTIVLQQKIVDLTRQINPEKQGSIYNVNFQKKWLDSCDELERAQIGQASFHAYKTMSGACSIAWLVLVILSFVTDIGLLPILVVILLWGVLQVSYTLACIRLSHHR